MAAMDFKYLVLNRSFTYQDRMTLRETPLRESGRVYNECARRANLRLEQFVMRRAAVHRGGYD